MAGFLVVLGQVQACAGWLARTESRIVYRLGLHLWRVRVMASMIGTGTAFTLKHILPRVLLVVPVSCQDFSILFDVMSGREDFRDYSGLFTNVQ